MTSIFIPLIVIDKLNPKPNLNLTLMTVNLNKFRAKFKSIDAILLLTSGAYFVVCNGIMDFINFILSLSQFFSFALSLYLPLTSSPSYFLFPSLSLSHRGHILWDERRSWTSSTPLLSCDSTK
jgi:hypothetical protein